MFPPAADSVHAFSPQPVVRQPDRQSLTSESRRAIDDLDVAQLRFVRILVNFGATLEQAGAVVAAIAAAEIQRAARGKHRRHFTLSGRGV
jgi:hypothetical protein